MEICVKHEKDFSGDDEYFDFYADIKKKWSWPWSRSDDKYEIKLSKDGDRKYKQGKALFAFNPYNEKIYVIVKSDNQTYVSQSFKDSKFNNNFINEDVEVNSSKSLSEIIIRFKNDFSRAMYGWTQAIINFFFWRGSSISLTNTTFLDRYHNKR